MVRQLGVLLLVVTCIIYVSARMRPVICPIIYRPVCASDGKTYDSECEMLRGAAENVNVAHTGKCRTKRHTDECFACPAILLPVCGTDGKTYSNECDLRCNGRGAGYLHHGSCNA